MLPMIYCIITSFKPLDELLIFPPRFFISRPTLENYLALPSLLSNIQVSLGRYFFNSLFVTVIGTALHIIAASLAAFAFSKSKNRFLAVSFWIIQIMMLYNGVTLGVPQYFIFSKMKILDSYWVYILPAIPSTMGCFLMKQFIDVSIPDALLEAARIDGAGTVRIYWSIVLPNLKAALMTLLLFSFQSMWALVPSGTIFSEELKTLPQAVSSIAAGGIARSGSAMAVTVLLMLPPMIVFVLTQSNVVETMSNSGIKE